MPDVFIIMGDGGTRKSGLIRCLSGAYNGGEYDIENANGRTLGFLVEVRSLQESATSPARFIRQVNNLQVNNILVALRIRGIRSQPNGNQYISAFINAGWNIRGITILGSTAIRGLPQNCPTPFYIGNPSNLPANNMAHQVRNNWQFR